VSGVKVKAKKLIADSPKDSKRRQKTEDGHRREEMVICYSILVIDLNVMNAIIYPFLTLRESYNVGWAMPTNYLLTRPLTVGRAHPTLISGYSCQSVVN